MAAEYSHIAGPYKGGLHVDYDVVPYLPIKDRQKRSERPSEAPAIGSKGVKG